MFQFGRIALVIGNNVAVAIARSAPESVGIWGVDSADVHDSGRNFGWGDGVEDEQCCWLWVD